MASKVNLKKTGAKLRKPSSRTPKEKKKIHMNLMWTYIFIHIHMYIYNSHIFNIGEFHAIEGGVGRNPYGELQSSSMVYRLYDPNTQANLCADVCVRKW